MLLRGHAMHINAKLLLLLAGVISLLAFMPVAHSESMASSGVGIRISLTDYDPSPAKPGKYVTLYLKAENSGGDELKNAIFKLELEYPFSLKPGESAIREFSSIGAQESLLLEYDLYVDKNALEDTYTSYLKLCLDSNCTTFARTPFSITVQPGGTPNIEVGLEDSDVFSSGLKGAVTINVVNRGLLNTKFLAMELQPSNKYEIISPARIYIGELESDDFETAEFDIFIKENVATNESETISLPVLVEYSDANDKEYSETFDVPLKVYSKSDLTRMQLVPDKSAAVRQVFMIIAALVFAFLFYRWYKKKSSS